MSAKRWFTTSSGRIEIEIELEDARSGSHQGACDDDIAALRAVGYIAAQLEVMAPELLRAELKEYGAWDAEQLADHSDNLDRILWIACGDIVEECGR